MASLRAAARLRPVASRITAPTATLPFRRYASAATATSDSSTPTEEPFFPTEPSAPIIKTKIPGPKSQQALKELDTVFDTRSVNMLGDYGASIGNYIGDPDGNMLLDV